jgi:hypothetical protein
MRTVASSPAVAADVTAASSASPGAPAGGAAPSGPPRIPRLRLVLLLAGGIAMVTGTWTGLARAGVHRPIGPFADHGIIMVLGFLGTVIALERAVALRHRWPYVAPALGGLSTVWLLAGLPRVGAAVLLTAAGLLLVAAEVSILRVRIEAHHVLLGVGAVTWVAAAVLWGAGMTPVRLTPLLAAFLVLTIVGERLELSRLTLPGAASRRRFLAAVGLFVVGVALAVPYRTTGLVVGGLSLLAQVAWLVRHDVARRTIRRPGLPRFAAACLLGGYVWLAVSGALWVAIGLGARGPLLHDALVHALFLGFVLSMVMGHAPIVVPAVLRVPMHFLRAAYAPLVLLHVSVALRVGADLAGSPVLREWAMHGNIAALFLFVAVAVVATRRGRASLRAPVGVPA